MIAVDTNVLLYSIDRHEPAKQARAQQTLHDLHAAGNVVLLWQVLGEVGQQLRRWYATGRISKAEFDQHVAAFRFLFPLMTPTPAAFDQALLLAESHSLSHWDSMLLGACKASGVTRLFTEDMGAPQTIDGIELVNPFA
jgi:predicted nucleic acid-binding protein